MQKQVSLYNSINAVMVEWNPLGVEGPALNDEYISIIPSMMRLKVEENEIAAYLRQTMEEHFGLSYNQEEFTHVSHEIFHLLLQK
jgi:hypothetical protein